VRPKLRLFFLHAWNFWSPAEKLENIINSPASSAPPPPTLELLERQPLKILITPSRFKSSFGPEHVANAIEVGIRKVVDGPSVVVLKLPLHNGAEGFCRALVVAHDGESTEGIVTEHVSLPISSHIGFVGKMARLLCWIWQLLQDHVLYRNTCETLTWPQLMVLKNWWIKH